MNDGIIPDIDASFDLEAAKAAERAYSRLTDAEIIDDPQEFTKAYSFAAHRSARHLRAALIEIDQLQQKLSSEYD